MSDAFSDKAPIEVGDTVRLKSEDRRKEMENVEIFAIHQAYPDPIAKDVGVPGVHRRMSWLRSKTFGVDFIYEDSCMGQFTTTADIVPLDEFGRWSEDGDVNIPLDRLELVRKGGKQE